MYHWDMGKCFTRLSVLHLNFILPYFSLRYGPNDLMLSLEDSPGTIMGLPDLVISNHPQVLADGNNLYFCCRLLLDELISGKNTRTIVGQSRYHSHMAQTSLKLFQTVHDRGWHFIFLPKLLPGRRWSWHSVDSPDAVQKRFETVHAHLMPCPCTGEVIFHGITCQVVWGCWHSCGIIDWS